MILAIDRREPGDRPTTASDDDLGTLLDALEMLAQAVVKRSDSNLSTTVDEQLLAGARDLRAGQALVHDLYDTVKECRGFRASTRSRCPSRCSSSPACKRVTR